MRPKTPPASSFSNPLLPFFLTCFFLAACADEKPSPPPLSLPLPIAFEESVLPNGMRLLILPSRRVPSVTHMVWYRVGSADEAPEQAGVAHYLEHMMFRDPRFEKRGGFSNLITAKGGVSNAFTYIDATAYYQRVTPEHLPQVMRMEAERMQSLQITPTDSEKERHVVLEERLRRMDASPSAPLHQKMRRALYGAHPYGRPIIGYEDTIRDLDRQDLLLFHRRHYAPQNATLILAGDITPEEAKNLANQFYAPLLPEAEWKAPPSLPLPEKRQKEARIVQKDSRITQARFSRVYVVPNIRQAPQNDAAALSVLVEILGGGRINRLHQNLVENNSLAIRTSASLWILRRGPGEIWLSATPVKDETLPQMEEALDALLQNLVKEGVREEEILAAKRKIYAEWIYSSDRQRDVAQIFGYAMMSGLPASEVNGWSLEIDRVQREDLLRVASRYLKPERAVTGLLVPQDSPDPEDPEEPER